MELMSGVLTRHVDAQTDALAKEGLVVEPGIRTARSGKKRGDHHRTDAVVFRIQKNHRIARSSAVATCSRRWAAVLPP